MATVYSVRIGAASVPPNPATLTLYTVAAGETLVIREIDLVWLGVTSGSVRVNDQTIPLRVLDLAADPAGVYSQWKGRLVIPSGGVVRVQGSAPAVTPNITLSGYSLH